MIVFARLTGVIVLLGSAAFAVECGANQSLFNHATAGSAKMTTAAGGAALNNVTVWGYYNDYACDSTNIAYIVTVADNTSTNYYGFAVVSPLGQIVCTTGARSGSFFAPSVSAGGFQQAWTSGCTIPQGQVFLAIGSTCTTACAVLAGDVAKGSWYWAIAPNTSPSVPWTFNGSGFSGIASSNLPVSALTLSNSATQSVVSTTANVVVVQSQISHVYVGTYITVGGTGTALDCANCAVTAVNPANSTISYALPTGSTEYSGTVAAGTVVVPPSLAGVSGITPPTVMIY